MYIIHTSLTPTTTCAPAKMSIARPNSHREGTLKAYPVGNQLQEKLELLEIITFEVQCIHKCAKKNKTAYPHALVHHVRRQSRTKSKPTTLNNKILSTILALQTFRFRVVRQNLGQLALQRLDLGDQVLHLLGLRRNRLGLLGNQVLNFLDLAVHGASGQARLASSRGGSGGSLKLLEWSESQVSVANGTYN